jgi:HTH-type transcriptional regulator / antitoxin HigA
MIANGGLRPRWASAPGETIASIIDERKLDSSQVATRLQLSANDFDSLVNGSYAITISLARSLANVLGASSEFWMTREAQYVDDAQRVAADKWSRELPIKQMTKFGWIEAPKDWHERIEFCLDFFRVDNVESWEAQYRTQLTTAHFRRSPTFTLEESATAVWFRACERESENLAQLRPFEPGLFQSAMPAIRKLTRAKDPGYFLPRLKQLCAAAGVAVAVVPTPSGCPASGAARWFKNNPLIQLSARHLSDDHFWFSFFHEAGHVSLHPIDNPFIDLLEDESSDRYENEANVFAMTALVGSEPLPVPTRWTTRALIEVAQRRGVSPGVVVGQLQHRGTLPPNRFNRLKRRYAWQGSTLEMR